MRIRNLTDAAAVRSAMEEFDVLGGPDFRDKYEFGASSKFYVQHNKKLYDAKSIVGAAYGYQYEGEGPLANHEFDGGEAGANPILRNLGFTVLSSETTTRDAEFAWRMAVWANLVARADKRGLLSAGAVRDVGAYGGQQGVWVDTNRTKKIRAGGVAVALKHTGQDYPDEFNEDSALYHYPVTRRKGHDAAEVKAVKVAADLELPIFAISEVGQLRRVLLGWVAGWDDQFQRFLVSFAEEAPSRIIDRDQSDEIPFNLEGNRSHRKNRSVKVRPDQPRFKLEVIKRYGPRCPLTGTDVPEMIDGAHLRGDADGGSSHPLNGLPMNVALHRAFDAHLFAIHPKTCEVHTLPGGPNIDRLGITNPRLELEKMPHGDALAWRYNQWLRHNKIGADEAVTPSQ
ncbi:MULTISPECIES: HNH endonuclease signature motif containing protein [unclassified Streptomyces]|uniref:HNH endonuclease n=1 Tax=unclassified Streptomyces TaxID=2593676 RepID=UPI0014896CA7|nr:MULTISPECIES: HNH endonuclease signature motif containing protein [unclassified Streptomyces]